MTDTITIAEIAKLLNVHTSYICHLQHAKNSTMPNPLYKKNRIAYFDRERVLAWIDNRKKPAASLDNSLAKQFLTAFGAGKTSP